MTEVRGVVATGKVNPVKDTTIRVPERGPGAGVARVQACGARHTDYREGGSNGEFPSVPRSVVMF